MTLIPQALLDILPDIEDALTRENSILDESEEEHNKISFEFLRARFYECAF